MAINYFEGLIGAASAKPADDARIAIKTAVAGVTGWSLLDDGYTASSITRTVLKCESATSGLPNDFYIILHNSTTAGATTLWVSICEGYSTSTHDITYGQIVGHATDAYCRSTSTVTALSTAYGDSNVSSTTQTGAFAIVANVNKYWAISVFEDGICFGEGNTGTARMLYAGAFTSLLPTPATNDPMPIAIVPFGYNDGGANYYSNYYYGSTVAVTRFAMNPNLSNTVPGSLAGGYRGGKTLMAAVQAQYIAGNFTIPAMYTSLDPYVNKTGIQVSPILLLNAQYATGTTALYGSTRGRVKNVLYAPSTTGSFGDTITMDTGAVYTKITGTSNYWVRKS